VTSAADVDGLELRRLLEAIYGRYGYDPRGYAPTPLRCRIDAICAKHRLDHLGELQHRILRDEAFFAEIVEDLTANAALCDRPIGRSGGAGKRGRLSRGRADAFAENYRRAGRKKRVEDYCSRAYGRIAIKSGVRKNVVLFQHDLATDRALGEMHVVNCRNVLSYFTPALRDRVVGVFEQAVMRGGLLCLRGAERLPRRQLHAFVPFVEQSAIYRARGTS
jgi:chemotaxis methyl-accepting protein methylase